MGAENLTALVVNTVPDEHVYAVEFMSRMPYTFMNAETDSEHFNAWTESWDIGRASTVLLDRNGHVLYAPRTNSEIAIQPTVHLLKMLLAHEAREKKNGVKTQ
jgi:hypothetical protein